MPTESGARRSADSCSAAGLAAFVAGSPGRIATLAAGGIPRSTDGVLGALEATRPTRIHDVVVAREDAQHIGRALWVAPAAATTTPAPSTATTTFIRTAATTTPVRPVFEAVQLCTLTANAVAAIKAAVVVVHHGGGLSASRRRRPLVGLKWTTLGATSCDGKKDQASHSLQHGFHLKLLSRGRAEARRFDRHLQSRWLAYDRRAADLTVSTACAGHPGSAARTTTYFVPGPEDRP